MYSYIHRYMPVIKLGVYVMYIRLVEKVASLMSRIFNLIVIQVYLVADGA